MQLSAVAGVPGMLMVVHGVHGSRQSSAADLMDDVNVLTPCPPDQSALSRLRAALYLQ